MALKTEDGVRQGGNRAGNAGQRLSGPGTLFGVPIGDLGWFASLLMGTATGFAAFFAATFLGIVSILFYNTAMHKNVDFAYSYIRVGLPVGLLVLVVALGYLGVLWVRRITRK
jgi:ABC-type dipeptide/oligopeptide/nickel transport system permease subunit